MKNYFRFAATLVLIVAFVSGCTKSRRAELPEDQQAGIFAISEFGEPSTSSVSVPARMKFMFNELPLLEPKNKDYKIAFSVDREFVTAYKVAESVTDLSILESAISLTAREVQLIAKAGDLTNALQEKEEIKSGKKQGALLVPLFKYSVESYGVVKRAKNDLKEETSRLELKKTEWKEATHIQISAQTDARKVVGMSVDQADQLRRIFPEDRVNNQLTTAGELQKRFSIGMGFIKPEAQVFTRLDASVMRVYEVTTLQKLNERQRRLLQNGNQEVIPCQNESVKFFVNSNDPECVLVLKADVPVSYKAARLTPTDTSGRAAPSLQFEDVSRARSVGLVEIKENITAKQVDITGALDPASTVKLSDLKGEFFYRRTFESASNMFMGRTGTSGDMTIIGFELEDKRIVVRNRQSLISYTGQGAKDREELMSFPAKYIRMKTRDAHGATLTIPQAEETTKENAEYASIDWTDNSVPDSNSPLAFYAGGKCFRNTTSLQVTDTDLRLSTAGVLNYSLSGSYTVNPTVGCVASEDVNSAYWKGSHQFNFNVKERISFMKKTAAHSDEQFAMNVSSMAQAAFNFGVFTLADKVTGNDMLTNRDGSEKYMPLVHDFRNGKKLKYHVGGINNPEITTPARRKLMVEATKQVIEEWNRTLRLAFKGTPLERSGDYVEVEFDNSDSAGHLGDLDRNYIWFNELPAENGLLGVAQPAANPRSGIIHAANVIVYTGNAMEQTIGQLKMTELGRKYEKMMEEHKAKEIAKLENEATTPSTADPAVLDYKVPAISVTPEKLSAQLFRKRAKGATVAYPENGETYIQKLMDASAEVRDPKKLELVIHKSFIQHGNLDSKTKTALGRRSEMLAAAIRFDEANAGRPGCFSYARGDINDEALTLSADPEENKMLNFRKNLMSTLSHELGHAFGLLHNFKASTDAANYEFEQDKDKPTGRNYSSIMDYMPDIDMNYRGPGPYDAHALRAAYTGMVEMADDPSQLVSIPALMKKQKIPSLVHFTKRSIPPGIFKHYEQCDDTGISESALCTQFDSGGTATEIVQNLIQNYQRSYQTRNYVHDKIIFGGEQKQQIVTRTIGLFQDIRSFLDEAVMAVIYDTGLTADADAAKKADLINAAKVGYIFFHELLRTPDAPEVSAMNIARRLEPYRYEYTNEKKETVKAVRILEKRAVNDVEITQEKLDTVGISLDKVFAMSFLLQSTAVKTDSDTRQSRISYLNFEQWFLGINNPVRSPIMNTIFQVLANRLRVGFFAPSQNLQDLQLLQFEPLGVNRILGQQTALATVVSLTQNKWSTFDPYAEMFKVSKASIGSAPAGRPNLAKAGQSRELSDTKVMFASQNALFSEVLVETAATNEYYAESRTMLNQAMAELLMPETDTAAIESELLAKLRADNTRGQVIRPEMDKDDSPVNLKVQVAMLKPLMQSQIALVANVKELLEKTEAADLGNVLVEIRKIRAQNDAYAGLPLLATAFTFVLKNIEDEKFSLKNDESITTHQLAHLLMPIGKVEKDLNHLQDTVERLSGFTAIVDPDTVLQ